MKNNLFITLISIAFLMGCSKESSSPSSNQGGTSNGGSLALYAFHQNFMYKISGNSLSIFNVSDAKNPVFIKEKDIEPGIETIMTDKYLFFGSRTGLIIYSLSNPADPSHLTTYSHVTSCDPVIIDGNIAFVTLSSQTDCRGVNELHILDFSNINDVQLLSTLRMYQPQGLASNGDLLYICEGIHGLTILDKSNLKAPKNVGSIANIHVIDAIFKDNILSLRGPDGIYTYDCQDPRNPVLLTHVQSK